MTPVVVGCPCGDRVLDAGDAVKVRSPVSAEKCCCAGGFPAKHQRQQVPVHLGVAVAVAAGVDGDGIGGYQRAIGPDGCRGPAVMAVAWASRSW